MSSVDPAISAHLSRIGSRGGVTTAKRMTAQDRKERAKKAAKASALVRSVKESSLASALRGGACAGD